MSVVLFSNHRLRKHKVVIKTTNHHHEVKSTNFGVRLGFITQCCHLTDFANLYKLLNLLGAQFFFLYVT